MEKIIGLINAPFTPFYENGEVNYEPIEAYAKMLVKNGLQGVFINGSSGEGYMLTDEERMKLAERWVEVSPKGFANQIPAGALLMISDKPMEEDGVKTEASDRKVTQQFVGEQVMLGVEALQQILDGKKTIRHIRFSW